MAEPHRRKPAIIQSVPWLCAILLVLSLTGCEALEKLGHTKAANPVLPDAPDRKPVANSNDAAKKPADAPVRLDGTAVPDGPQVIPNAPGFDNSPLVANPSAPGVRSPGGDGANGDGATAGGDLGAGDAAGGMPLIGKEDGSPITAGRTTPGAKRSTKEGVVHGDYQKTDDKTTLDAANDPGTDVISPIEFEGAGTKFQKGELAALVNGAPIFSEDILRELPEQLAQQLAQAEKAAAEGKAKPEDVRRFRTMLIARGLQPLIERELMLQEVKKKLKPEQLAGLTKHLDAAFNSEGLPAAMKKAGVATEQELDAKLKQEGSSIEMLRTSFRNKQVAQQYLAMKGLVANNIDRPDIRKYYEEHKADYFIAAKAKWEQIQFKDEKNGGIEGSRKKAEEILERLDGGDIFAVVAKECSNGSTASQGGLWPWTTKGSIKSKEIDKALFEQTVGEISFPIETETSIEIIRVIDRNDGGYRPFHEVEEEIKGHLKNVLFQRRVAELIKELNAKATIEKFKDKW